MSLEEALFGFLDKYYAKGQPVLLGLSGGSDSLALLYLLESYGRRNSFQFGIAHVDHGWRIESADEAQQLHRLAEDMKIPFHKKTLDPAQLSGNLEEACRHERLAFFSQLGHEYDYQAVILGHHADDQSETILKKVLEGASLPYLQGMASVSTYQGLKIWRPLLNCSKAQIRDWLSQKGYVPFEDRTNHDQQFLRGRFRTKIIPELSRDFGKEVGSCLRRIGSEAEELKVYLEEKLDCYIQNMAKGPFGSCLDLETDCPEFDFEIRYLIRKGCEKEGIKLSRHLIDEACKKIRSKSADCWLMAKEAYIYLDRGRLFIMKRPLMEFLDEIPLQAGHHSSDEWNIFVSECEDEKQVLSGWKEAWMGRLQVSLPAGEYVLKRGDNALSKWWTNQKVPAFMRKAFPVIVSKNGIIHEFLTKRRFSNILAKSGKQWLISVTHEYWKEKDEG